MIAELAHFALILAFLVALAQSIVPMLGAVRGNAGWMALGARAAGAFFVLCSLSFAALLVLFATCDFSVTGVAMNDHTLLPLAYRVAAAWGNHEGSMLLWVWILSVWGALAAWRGKILPPAFLARALSLQGMIGAGFLAFILFASNPFLRLDPPAPEGAGLNPVLQDPALAIHPPLLYAGYVGFSVAFCFAMAALLENNVGRVFARVTKPWALGAWACLTAGIAMGSLWAYYELGWGGFWFWDPVENASLMPWLAGAALVHALAVLEKRDTLKGWTVFLAILAFSFSLLGTFLVRSGVLTSVHAFAVDPQRGLFILALLSLAVGGAFTVYALRAPAVKAGAPFGIFSRETMMLLNNVFLFSACSAVFMGTLYPVFMSALDLGAVAVGPPYFAAVMLPLLAPFVVLMGAAPHIGWQRGDAKAAALRLALPLVVAVLPLAVPAALGRHPAPLAVLGYGLALFLALATLADVLRRRKQTLSYYAMVVAHLGFAVFIAGATGATQNAVEKTQWMSPGDRLEIAGRTLVLLGHETALGPSYNIARTVFEVRGDGKPFFMAPEKRWHPAAASETSETALAARTFSILYLALGEREKGRNGRVVVRAYFHPLVLCVFGGGLLMALGGLMAALAGRQRDV